MRTLAILLALGISAFGQRHKLEEVDSEKPEGKMLQQCLQESDPGKKAALMEQFASQYPKLEATAWILEQLETYYVKANQPDQIISAGDRLLTLDPDDPEAGLQALKAAEAKKDVALIMKFSGATYTSAGKMAAAPQPKDAGQVESWKQEVDYAKQVCTYADYALFRASLESQDPRATIQLGEMLTQRSGDSEYGVKVRQPLFLAYRQAGANDKAIALAEKTVVTDQGNEDMLLVLANSYLEQKKEPEKVHSYSAKIVEIMSAKPKPEGASDADWAARKGLVTGLAYFMSGKLYSNENKFQQSDQQLRKALPLVESNAALKPETLFLLGLANYKMASGSPERAQESANYFRSCSAIKSPFQATAAANLKRIMTEYHGIK